MPCLLLRNIPEKPAALLAPDKAGDSTETMARVYSRALGAAWGANAVFRTRPGAVGATEVANASADGYGLLFAAAMSLSPPVTQKIEHDLDSFAYFGQITE